MSDVGADNGDKECTDEFAENMATDRSRWIECNDRIRLRSSGGPLPARYSYEASLKRLGLCFNAKCRNEIGGLRQADCASFLSHLSK